MLQFDRRQLLEVLKAFYVATGARVAICNTDYQEIISYPPTMCPLCQALNQEPAIHAMCQACNQAAFLRCQTTATHDLYQCHMGLFEAVAPIVLHQTLEGYIMMGQVLPSKEDVYQRAKRYQLNTTELSYLMEPMETISMEKLEGVTVLMHLCVEYLCMSQVLLTASPRAQKVDAYILANLSTDLNPQDIAAHFFISRTTLHTIVTEAFGMSTTQRIHFLRIETAKKLLMQGMRVDEICTTVGYSDRNYFYKQFKRHTHLTVRQFLFGQI